MERDCGSAYPPSRKIWGKVRSSRQRRERGIGAAKTFPVPTKLAGRRIQRISEEGRKRAPTTKGEARLFILATHVNGTSCKVPSIRRKTKGWHATLHARPSCLSTRHKPSGSSSKKALAFVSQRERESLSDGWSLGEHTSFLPGKTKAGSTPKGPSWPLEGSYASGETGRGGSVKSRSL